MGLVSTRLTSDGAEYVAPTWYPVTSKITFESDRESGSDLSDIYEINGRRHRSRQRHEHTPGLFEGEPD